MGPQPQSPGWPLGARHCTNWFIVVGQGWKCKWERRWRGFKDWTKVPRSVWPTLNAGFSCLTNCDCDFCQVTKWTFQGWGTSLSPVLTLHLVVDLGPLYIKSWNGLPYASRLALKTGRSLLRPGLWQVDLPIEGLSFKRMGRKCGSWRGFDQKWGILKNGDLNIFEIIIGLEYDILYIYTYTIFMSQTTPCFNMLRGRRAWQGWCTAPCRALASEWLDAGWGWWADFLWLVSHESLECLEWAHAWTGKCLPTLSKPSQGFRKPLKVLPLQLVRNLRRLRGGKIHPQAAQQRELLACDTSGSGWQRVVEAAWSQCWDCWDRPEKVLAGTDLLQEWQSTLPCFALLCPAVGHGFRFRALGAREELESLRSGTEVLVLVLVASRFSKNGCESCRFLMVSS